MKKQEHLIMAMAFLPRSAKDIKIKNSIDAITINYIYNDKIKTCTVPAYFRNGDIEDIRKEMHREVDDICNAVIKDREEMVYFSAKS